MGRKMTNAEKIKALRVEMYDLGHKFLGTAKTAPETAWNKFEKAIRWESVSDIALELILVEVKLFHDGPYRALDEVYNAWNMTDQDWENYKLFHGYKKLPEVILLKEREEAFRKGYRDLIRAIRQLRRQHK
jgi:hypothetical protein